MVWITDLIFVMVFWNAVTGSAIPMSPLGRNLPFPQAPPNICGAKQEIHLNYHNNALWNVTMGNARTIGFLQGVPTAEAQEEVILGDIIIQLAAPGGITFDLLNVCMDVKNGQMIDLAVETRAADTQIDELGNESNIGTALQLLNPIALNPFSSDWQENKCLSPFVTLVKDVSTLRIKVISGDPEEIKVRNLNMRACV